MFHRLRSVFRGDRTLDYRTGVVLVAGSGVIFSFGPILFRGVEGATDWQYITYRSGSAGVAMIVLFVARLRSRPVAREAVNRYSVLAGFLLAAMSMLFILALARTTAATIAFLQAAGPFSGALFGWLLLRERVERRTWIAMLVAAVGIGIMVNSGLGGGGSTSGFLLAALIPLFLGLYNTLLRAAPASDPVVPAFIAGASLAIVAGAVASANGGLAVSWRDFVLACISGGVVLGLGLPAFNLGHLAVPAAQVSLLLMTEVVLGPIWVWIWPGETPSIGTLVGGLIVLAAVLYLVASASEGRRRWVGRR